MPLDQNFDKINSLMCTTSRDGYFIYLNPHWSNVLGWSLPEIMAKPFIEYVHPEDRDLTIKTYQKMLAGDDVSNFRNRYRTHSGEYVWLQWVATLLLDGSIIASVHEISDLVLVENKLKQHALILEQVSTLGHLGHWNVNFATKEVFWSKEIYAIHGVTPESYTPDLNSAIRFYHPDDIQRVTEYVNRALAEAEGWSFTLRIIRPDGNIRVVRSLAEISRDSSGDPASVFGVFQDVTEHEALNKQVELLSHVANTATVGVTICDSARKVIWINKAFTALTGYELDDFMEVGIANLLQGPKTDPATVQKIKNDLDNGKDIDVDILNYHKDGTEYWNNLLISSVKDSAGNITHFIGIQNDISDKKQVEANLKRSASVFTHAHEGIIITDGSGNIIEVNDAFTQITGYAPNEVIGKNPRILQSGRHTPDFYAEMWDRLVTKGYWRGEIYNRRKNGEIYPEILTISAVQSDNGVVQHYVSLSTDITPIKDYQGQLERIAHYDVLTNLPNRVLLADRLSHAIAQCQRHKKLLAVAFLDLDGFKDVNDIHGHDVGDELLVAVSQRMKTALRETDTLARIGGDEFVVIMADLTRIEDSEPLLNRLLNAAADPVSVGDEVMQVSASIGVTVFPQDGADADQLIRHADQAMYMAKQAGKNRYHIFDIAQENASKTRAKSIGNVRLALEHREFVLHYQPKVNMRTGEVIGAEALIRWQHPVKGLVPPLDFLPAIEGQAVSIDLGEWVINTALSQISQWQSMGINLPVSVNISAYQIQQANFTHRLAVLLAAHPEVSPSSLELEILETSALHDTSQVSDTMNACHELGVCFALDDFGTGYSSLTYLKRLPAHMIKIDQSFVRDMLEDADDLAIIEGVVGLAKAFQRNVIAEGVETVSHGVALLELGCELAQGYGIAKPMPAADIPEWQASWKAYDSWLQ
jgi:diguanylate cyclase (GGDEF)-like protein/PAS domain S-box-containing protein